MSFSSWLRSCKNVLTRSPLANPPRRSTKRSRAPRLNLEVLEERVVPTTAVYFDDMVGGTAVDSGGNQYVNYSKLHGTVDLDPGTSTTLVNGYDFTDFGNSNPQSQLKQFLVKYSPTQEVLWAKSITDRTNFVRDLKIAADDTGEHLYAFGAAVTKMNVDDGTVAWSKGLSNTSVYGNFIDSAGSIYASGSFSGSADLDTSTTYLDGRDLVSVATGQGMFVAKWGADGSLLWSRVINATATPADPSPAVWTGATTSNFGTIAVANDIVYAGGMYRGTLSLGGLTNDRIDSASTSPDGFVATYDTNGNFQSVAHFIDAQVSSVRASGSDVYLTAQFGYTVDLDPGAGQKLLTPVNINGESLAVARLAYTTAPTPTWSLSWADKFVSSGNNLGGGLEVSGTDLYVSGAFGTTTDFDPSSGTHNLTAGGEQDIFAMKLNAVTGGLVWVSQMGSTQRLAVGPTQENAGLALIPTGPYAGIYLGGCVAPGTVNFNGTKIMDAGLDRDAFVAKLGTDGSYQSAFGVGAVGRTIDDSNPGYAESGSGWKSQSVGWNGESRTHAKGNGSNAATWTFTGLPNGTYQVVTQFPASNKNASNAPFRVNGTLVAVDQSKAPSDFATAYDGLWKNLGTFTVTNGTLTVVLSDAANGTVVADAMQIWFVAPPAAPQVGSFNASSYSVTAGAIVTLTASNITDANPGATIIQVTFFYFDGNGTKVSPGTGTQTSPGVWTLSFATTGWASGTYHLFAQALDSYGYLSDPLALDLQVL